MTRGTMLDDESREQVSTVAANEPPDEVLSPAHFNLTGAVLHGLKWSYGSTFVTGSLQIAVTAVLARLLTPGEFGLVAMAAVFLRFGQAFSQMGAGQAVVQRRTLSPSDVHTAFTSSILLGSAFALLFVALAPLTTLLFPQAHGVVTVTRVMAVTFVFGGVSAPTQGLLRRRFAFKAIALTEVASYVVGYAAVGMTMAARGAGAWSLVTAMLCQAGLAAVIYSVLSRRHLGIALARSSFVKLYSFGGRVSVISFLEFLASTLDVLWTGHFLGTRATGLYTRATNLASVPLSLFTTSLSRVLLPAYSRIQDAHTRLRQTYLTTITVVAAVAMPVAWGVAGASNAVVSALLGSQWSRAVPVLAVLSLAVPLTLLTHFGAILCEATATLNVKMALVAARLAWLAVLLMALGRYGVVAIAAAFALSELLTHVAYLLMMRRLLSLTWSDLAAAYSQGVASGAVVGVALYALDAALRSVGLGGGLRLGAAASAGFLILAVSIFKLRGGHVWRELRTRWAARPEAQALADTPQPDPLL